LIVLDINVTHEKRMESYKAFRALSVIPLIMILPAYHENEILEAYNAGVDDVVIKPISPPVFMAKVLAWIRRSWTMPVGSLSLVNAGDYKLDPSRRCMIDLDGTEVKLTNLEFHLLHLLMSRPGRVFNAEEIIQAIWGGYGHGDQVLLKPAPQDRSGPGSSSFTANLAGRIFLSGVVAQKNCNQLRPILTEFAIEL
jgi:DNA-binding response OmpR family regulator